MRRSAERTHRLLMIVHSVVPGDPRVMAEAGVARDAGFEVDIVALRAPGQAPHEIIEDGIRAVRLPVQHVRGAGLLHAVREYASFTARAVARAAGLARARHYHVVEVHNPPDFLLLAGLIPKLLGARLVLDVHDLTSDLFDVRYGGGRGARQLERVLRFIERRAFALADDILTVHEPYRRELVARGARPERVTIVMNTVAANLLPPVASPAAGGPFRVVYHGTITPHYGVELLVRAVARARDRIPDVQLDVFGSGDSLASSIETAERVGLGDRVRFVESLSRRDVLAAVNGASVGVVPSLPTRHNRRAVSTKLFEYVALQIPAVVADLPTSRVHFTDDEMLFFRAGDEVALADALVVVARHPDAARERADAALMRYEAYKWERNADRYVDVLARGHRRRRRR